MSTLSPYKIARATVFGLLDVSMRLSPGLSAELGVERDRRARLGTMWHGEHAFVLTSSAPRGIAIQLDRCLDVSFPVEGPDLAMQVWDFHQEHLRPAVTVLSRQLDAAVKEVIAAEHAAGEVLCDPRIAFASAPLPTSPKHSAVATRGGVSVRATLGYDMIWRRAVLTLDMLYGLRPLREVTR